MGTMKTPPNAVTMTEAQRAAHITSPALYKRSEHYPRRYDDRVPLTVRVVARHGVAPDYPMNAFPENRGLYAAFGEEFPAWTNSYGAVAIIFPDGRQLGVKPDEFEVTAWA